MLSHFGPIYEHLGDPDPPLPPILTNAAIHNIDTIKLSTSYSSNALSFAIRISPHSHHTTITIVITKITQYISIYKHRTDNTIISTKQNPSSCINTNKDLLLTFLSPNPKLVSPLLSPTSRFSPLTEWSHWEHLLPHHPILSTTGVSLGVVDNSTQTRCCWFIVAPRVSPTPLALHECRPSYRHSTCPRRKKRLTSYLSMV